MIKIIPTTKKEQVAASNLTNAKQFNIVPVKFHGWKMPSMG